MTDTAISSYCEALAAQRAAEAHFLKEVGDQWCTPDPIFWGINALYGPFVLDLFADADNTKCPAYYTAEDNALQQDWSARLMELGGASFGNPPYSRTSYHNGIPLTGMRHIVEHALSMRDLGGRYVFLLKAATSEVWWPEQADHVCFIRGRIGFELPAWFRPADEKQQPTGAFFAGAIVVFDKSWRGPAFGYIGRDDLISKGTAFLALVQHVASRVKNVAIAPVGGAEVVAPPRLEESEIENRIWPLEVGLMFNQVQHAADLPPAQQNKLKANINRMWLERVPSLEILAAAGGLVETMGASHA